MRETPYFSVLCTTALLAAVAMPASGAEPGCAPKLVQRARVAGVEDARTLRLVDGGIVRLAGIQSPEAPGWWKDAAPWPALQRAREALEGRALGKDVALRIAAGEPGRDRHGRLLAQAYVLEGEAEQWIQGGLIGDGFALTVSFPASRTCARVLQYIEKGARDKGAGLWRGDGFRVFEAADTQQLAQRTGTYQLIEGIVVSVGERRNWTFLNFSRDWKTDFTVAVAAGDRRGFEAAGLSLVQLEGKRVRVRGWIERWNGPAIKASHAEQVEVLE